MKVDLEGKVQEVQYEIQMLRERDTARERLVQTLEDRTRHYQE